MLGLKGSSIATSILLSSILTPLTPLTSYHLDDLNHNKKLNNSYQLPNHFFVSGSSSIDNEVSYLKKRQKLLQESIPEFSDPLVELVQNYDFKLKKKQLPLIQNLFVKLKKKMEN
jgi:hypothetical protein